MLQNAGVGAHVEHHGSKTRTACDEVCHGTCHHALMSLFSQRVDRGMPTTQPNIFNDIIAPTGKAQFFMFIAEITIRKVYVLCAFQFQHAVYITATIFLHRYITCFINVVINY